MIRFVLTILMACSMASGAVAQPDMAGNEDFARVVRPQPEVSSEGFEDVGVFGPRFNEFIVNYGADGVLVRIGRPVGRLDVLDADGTTRLCSAFVVGEDLLLTSADCLPGPQGATPRAALFMAGYVTFGKAEGVQLFAVDKVPLETDPVLGFSVLRAAGAPGKAFGVVDLKAAMPKDGERLWIIGHPFGEAQRIIRERCAAARPALSRDGMLQHVCETLPGNAGSLVLIPGPDGPAVAGMHLDGSGLGKPRTAVPLSAILGASRILDPDR